MKILAELNIIPTGVGTSFSEYIAECERILKRQGLKVQMHAEGTNIEGDFDEIMAGIKKCIYHVHNMQVPRIITNIQLNTRIDKLETLEDKVKSVEELLE